MGTKFNFSKMIQKFNRKRKKIKKVLGIIRKRRPVLGKIGVKIFGHYAVLFLIEFYNFRTRKE